MRNFLLSIALISHIASAQNIDLKGCLIENGNPINNASISLKGTQLKTKSDTNGIFQFKNLPSKSYTILVIVPGFNRYEAKIDLKKTDSVFRTFDISDYQETFGEIVVSGTMKPVSKLQSPVPVEIYDAKFFRANPTPSIFESLQNINGVRPQLNCNVCNTGDIHINGLEGPYTMILIDGMPIVSGLSTVYGLTGIPQSLIERVEIVKGPASTLYGSEAVGGLINIITKRPANAPLFSADIFSSDWGDVNTDLGLKFRAGKKAQSLLGVNYFNYQNPTDKNNDGFTDLTLQNRISIFNKWAITRKYNREFSFAARYNYEDRWGGDMRFDNSFRGGDSIYGESIYTKRWELFGVYQLPTIEKIKLQFSANTHQQNSYYGTTPYFANQNIFFSQLTWNKNIGKHHDILLGASYRYTYFDDNTAATADFDTINIPKNKASIITLPGMFLQDEITLNKLNTLLVGLRYDYNSLHGNVFSPRLNFKRTSKDKMNVLRLSFGNGYRIANIFTEDHAALTGSRKVEFVSALKPETSWNGNINFVKKLKISSKSFLSIDGTAFYTYFNNRIIPDYEKDPNKIIYGNLNGHAVSQGVSINIDATFANGLKTTIGSTLMDVNFTNNGQKQRQLLTERWSTVWNFGYTFKKQGVEINYTGNLYGSMLLPLLSDLDNRLKQSPIHSIQNLQITKSFKKNFEFYGGLKNILNFTPPANSIARSFDPFDKQVKFDSNGQAISTPNNPYALTFDPTQMFASNQGRRLFFGMRYFIN